MKILQIAPPWIDTPPSEYGGTEQVIYNLVKGLGELGHKVTLYATKKSRAPARVVYTLKKSLCEQGLPWEAALPALLHYHQAFRLASDYDIVHAHLSSQTDIMTLPFLADLANHNIPAVLTIHGHRPYDRFSDSDEVYFDHYANNIYVINISKAMVKFTPHQFKKAGVIHNSLDTTPFSFNPNKGRYLTWMGKFLPEKNPVEAILTAKAAGIPIVFGGVIDRHNPVSVKYFETHIRPLIDNRTVIYFGPVKVKDKSYLLSNALGFLYPLDWEEPFGMVMAESMATGTPVIAYPKGAAPELVKDGETGFLVNNREEMLAAIRKLPHINRYMCRAHVESSFNVVKAAEQHVRVYAQVIKKYASTQVKSDDRPLSSLAESLNYIFPTISTSKRLR